MDGIIETLTKFHRIKQIIWGDTCFETVWRYY